ncbi:hypothetical protein EX30DRAFT_371496 [Ascodesmis nigricans]|uniref:Uncharacterized protein n=1 Tax=Ascodesmis nigricans TaxID=341454 RepID=A0A4S2MXR7_9PEZI|nr:hypothetical protein EX30DRAFT_371496 [Ascodesmis nigricans]
MAGPNPPTPVIYTSAYLGSYEENPEKPLGWGLEDGKRVVLWPEYILVKVIAKNPPDQGLYTFTDTNKLQCAAMLERSLWFDRSSTDEWCYGLPASFENKFGPKWTIQLSWTPYKDYKALMAAVGLLESDRATKFYNHESLSQKYQPLMVAPGKSVPGVSIAGEGKDVTGTLSSGKGATTSLGNLRAIQASDKAARERAQGTTHAIRRDI